MFWINRKTDAHEKAINKRKQNTNTVETLGKQRHANAIKEMATNMEKLEPNPSRA
jgi:hypothetical protein